MDDLHELAQAIGNAAYDREFSNSNGNRALASVAYHYAHRAVMNNADEIAFVYCNSELHKTPKNQKEIDRECVEAFSPPMILGATNKRTRSTILSSRAPAFSVGPPSRRMERIPRRPNSPMSAPKLPPLIRVMLPHQWLKNVFVFAGLLFSQAWHNGPLVERVLYAFLAKGWLK